jgi:D-sedoheptulose 7-phosphate isomerase
MLAATLGVTDYLDRLAGAMRRLDPSELEALSGLIERRWRDRRTVFIIGNGGSAANASHLCEDLAKCTLCDLQAQRRLRVLSLTDSTPWITMVGNDIGYESVFVEPLRNLAEPGDLLVAISGSGNSPNVLRAVEWANGHGLTTVGVTGFEGGALQGLAQHNLHAASDDMGVVETVHLAAFHWVIGDLYRRFAAAHNAGDVTP